MMVGICMLSACLGSPYCESRLAHLYTSSDSCVHTRTQAGKLKISLRVRLAVTALIKQYDQLHPQVEVSLKDAVTKQQAAMELYQNRPAGDRAAWLSQLHGQLAVLDAAINQFLPRYQQYADLCTSLTGALSTQTEPSKQGLSITEVTRRLEDQRGMFETVKSALNTLRERLSK